MSSDIEQFRRVFEAHDQFQGAHRMELHANAALSLKGRRSLVRSVMVDERTVTEAALAAGVSLRCARKWVGRYRQYGELGLRDRPSTPHRIRIAAATIGSR